MSDKGPIRLHDLSKKGGEHSSAASIQNVNKTTNRNLNETINRDVVQVRHSDTQRLTAAERARLLNDIDTFDAEHDAHFTADRAKLKGWVDSDRGFAEILEEAMNNRVNQRIGWANNEIQIRLDGQQDALSRLAGSSHNCYVQNMMDRTFVDAFNQQASIFADLDMRALQAEVEARDRTLREGSVAMLDSNDKLAGHGSTRWGLLKDALMTHDENQRTDDDTTRALNENITEVTLATSFQLSGRGWAEDTTDSAGSYAGDAGSYAADVAPF